MPPTYSPWLKAFESLARVGFLRRKRNLDNVRVGASQHDCRGSEDWRAFVTPEALHEAWGPPQASPWSPYHRPTLFAALDSVLQPVWPDVVEGLEASDAPLRVPEWAREGRAVLLDLPGPASVAYAAWLALRGGYEPVVTFNNWPHKQGLVDAHKSLGALVHFVPWAVEAKRERAAGAWDGRAPPAFVLDAGRLGSRKPRPKDFDNRYYLLDADFPTVAQFKRAGVERVVYVRETGTWPPDRMEMDDLNAYLHGLSKGMGVDVATAHVRDWSLGEPREYSPTIRDTPFTTVKDPKFRGFRRSAAGGFGELVPEPSSGGG